MEFPKKVIDSDSPSLVQMFCYIYVQIKSALEEQIESSRVKSLAREFQEVHLTSSSSLFSEDSFSETIAILKDQLNEIDRVTAYKDSDFWHFYEAIYVFLYGENEFSEDEQGNIWGLSNFSVIWEELCYSYAKEHLGGKIIYADRQGTPIIHPSFKSPFYLQINSEQNIRRKLRPDLVYLKLSESNHLEFTWPADLDRIYDFEILQIGTWQNLKIYSQKFTPHDFNDLDNLYSSYLRKNHKYQDTGDEKFANVAGVHINQFLEDVNSKITTKSLFDTSYQKGLISMRPCIVDFEIVDYKYIQPQTCVSTYPSKERLADIQKQLVYEFAIQLNFVGAKVSSQFWIPSYFDDSSIVFEELESLSIPFQKANITVLKFNFIYLQELYLKS